MQYLKQSTATTVKIGPFVDDVDGFTAETGLTILRADVRLSKNGGNIAQKTEATAATHDELGYYDCPIDATDTGTLGRLQLMVYSAGALPVWHEYTVLAANVYDSLILGPASDYLDVNTITMANIDFGATQKASIDTCISNSTIHTDVGTAITNIATLQADVGDASASALGSLYGILGNPAANPIKITVEAITPAVINTQCDTALSDIDLDHLAKVNYGAAKPTDGSLLDQIMNKAAGQTFDATTDSLEAVRDNMAGADAAAIADAVWDEVLTIGHDVANSGSVILRGIHTDTIAIKAITDLLTLAAVADAVHDKVIEGPMTMKQALRLLVGVLAGKSSGGGTATLVFRDLTDAKNRIIATVDADGNRTTIAYDVS